MSAASPRQMVEQIALCGDPSRNRDDGAAVAMAQSTAMERPLPLTVKRE